VVRGEQAMEERNGEELWQSRVVSRPAWWFGNAV